MKRHERAKTTGLIIGKFMPVHRGHQYLIDFARQRVDQLTIIIFTKPNEPVAGELRVGWIKRLFADVEIIHIAEEHRIDFADPTAWDLWISAIRKVYPSGPDFVFSSEDYGGELARRLGAENILVDRKRKQVPVSASLIRENPAAHWEFMPSIARPHFVRRVCLVGAESTGKTTLAQSLAEHFETAWVPEFARAYLEPKNWVCEWDDMILIAEGQGRLEDEMAERANRVLFCDTDQMTTSIWTERYFGKPQEKILEMARRRRYDLHFLCDIDIAWVDDGTRDSREWREWFHGKFLSEIAARRLPAVILSGSFDERMSKAIMEVTRLLESPF
jgi:NadR type nicotinamide-nucleotide adenylyltransferase